MNTLLNYRDYVREEWIDYNGHMNDAAYAIVFSLAIESFIDAIGLDAKRRDEYDYTIYTLETHLCYLQEAYKNEKLLVTLQLLDYDSKRLHVFLEMKNLEGRIFACSEQMLIGIDMNQRKSSPFPPKVGLKLEEIWKEHKDLKIPEKAGRKIGIQK